MNTQSIWWPDVLVALVLRAAHTQVPTPAAHKAEALHAAQVLRSSRAEGTMEIMQLNAHHGVLLI
jgi:hypothetical protein